MSETWYLRDVNVFAGLDPDEAAMVSAIFREERYQRGELLHLIDEHAERLLTAPAMGTSRWVRQAKARV